jgi:hypothetical protein
MNIFIFFAYYYLLGPLAAGVAKTPVVPVLGCGAPSSVIVNGAELAVTPVTSKNDTILP